MTLLTAEQQYYLQVKAAYLQKIDLYTRALILELTPLAKVLTNIVAEYYGTDIALGNINPNDHEKHELEKHVLKRYLTNPSGIHNSKNE